MKESSRNIVYPHRWKTKRISTLRMFVLLNFLHGVEWSLFFLVLWVYLKDLLRNDETSVKFYYAIITTSYLSVTILSMPLVGLIVDKTHRVKEALFIGNVLIILGNLLFSFPYSPYLLLAGRILAGFGGSTLCIFSSEIARCFENHDVIKQISMTSSAYIMGFVMGPCFGFAFTTVDFRISGSLRITYGNSAALFLTFCFFISTLLIPWFLFNISKEFDLKEASSKTPENLPLLQEKRSQHGVKFRRIQSKCGFLCNLTLLTIYSLSTLYQSSLILFDMWIPMVIVETLKWSPLEINLMFLGLSLLTFIFITISHKINITANTYFYILTISILCTSLLSWFLFGMKQSRDFTSAIFFIIIFCIIYALTAFVCTTIYPSSVANMVSSSHQALAESIRLGMGRVASCVALMTAPYIYDYVFTFSLFISVLYSVCLVIVISRRKYIIESIR